MLVIAFAGESSLMPRIPKILLLLASVALVLTVFLGANTTGVNAASDPQENAYRQINVYSEVLSHIQSDYVEEPNIPAVTNGALRGLLESLDSESSYLSPEENKSYKALKGGKAQVGINISKRFGYATVVSVVPNSPADKANLNDGDIIEAIGDKSTRDLSLAMIEMLLKGEPGTQVTISVVRPRKAAPDKIELTRAVTAMPAVAETQYENSTILYLKPGILDHDHVNQIESKLKGAKGKKLLLDLRDVADGDMAEGQRLANMLLKSGTIVTLEGQKFPKQTVTADPSKTIAEKNPVVVLVNRGTAGAAELAAAALLDNKRAELVGEKTFGIGSQQKTFELPDGAALILSVAKYVSPAGKKFEDEGVTPGVQVAGNFGDTDDDDSADNNAPAKPKDQVDGQLSKALEILKAKAA